MPRVLRSFASTLQFEGYSDAGGELTERFEPIDEDFVLSMPQGLEAARAAC